MNSKPVVLDLFSCAGGAARGYQLEGAHVIAVDLDDKALARNPADERYLEDWEKGAARFAEGADFIHASPPCQGYIPNNPNKDEWPRLVNDVREALRATGKPFVIENVPTCKDLVSPVVLTGCMFGLTVKWDVPKGKVRKVLGKPDLYFWETVAGKSGVTGHIQWGEVEFHLHRDRLFEAHGFTLTPGTVDPEVHDMPALTVVSGTPTGFWNQWYGATIPSDVKKQVMGIDWNMRGHDVAEALPPAYTRHIFHQFLNR